MVRWGSEPVLTVRELPALTLRCSAPHTLKDVLVDRPAIEQLPRALNHERHGKHPRDGSLISGNPPCKSRNTDRSAEPVKNAKSTHERRLPASDGRGIEITKLLVSRLPRTPKCRTNALPAGTRPPKLSDGILPENKDSRIDQVEINESGFRTTVASIPKRSDERVYVHAERLIEA